MLEGMQSESGAFALQPESGLDWRALWLEEYGARPRVEDAAHWDKRSVSFSATCQRSGYANDFLTRAGVRDGETVIDMGCGSGTLALPLACEGHGVTACDISQGMLDKLAEQADAAGVSQLIDVRKMSWLDEWKDLPKADLFFASRSLFSEDLYETILKIERHTMRRVCATVATLDSPAHDRRMLEFIGRPHKTRAEYVYLVNLLMQMGRYPEVGYIAHNKPVFGESLEDVRADFEREDGPFTPEESALLDRFIDENFTVCDEGDGCVVKRSYVRTVRWAFVAWDL